MLKSKIRRYVNETVNGIMRQFKLPRGLNENTQ